jgi:prepilin-type N-terminal cleavage/methylation domain-containing protein
MRNITKRQSGFTIIEVLIVLAIAGLILLVVFLAVPGLQRSSHNTQIKNAAATVLGAVSDYENNNGGSLPTTVVSAPATGIVTVSGAVGTTQSTATIEKGVTVTSSAAASPAFPSAANTMLVNLGYKCNNNAFSATASPRNVAVGYAIETSATAVGPQCTDE